MSVAGIDGLSPLAEDVRRYFQAHSASYGLCSRDVEVRYVLNWGGFVNASFAVTDGCTTYHLKLAREDETRAGLRLWHQHRARLEARYHAPRILDWVSLPGRPEAGLLFQYLAGESLSAAHTARVLPEIVAVLAHLHADLELALQIGQAPRPCLQTFLATYIRRFDEDLDFVRTAPPPFVSHSTLVWMEAETRELERSARTSAAFSCPGSVPIHGDLWSGNVLCGPEGEWHLLDWDNLTVGDPALDYSLLLAGNTAGPPPTGMPLPFQTDSGFAERFDLYVRAALLDGVIDVLADWIDAEVMIEGCDHVRDVKELQHREKLQQYAERYGNPT